LGESNASNWAVASLRARLPRSRRRPKHRPTSRSSGMAASSKADSTLASPSLRAWPMGICEPVKITGLSNPHSRNDRADALQAMVSVPCSTTKPS